MRIALLTRRPRQGANFSVERILETLLCSLGAEFRPSVTVARFASNGVIRRAYNVLQAAFHQGDVNHVLGDVHYLTYLLRKKRTILTILDCGRVRGRYDLGSRIVRLLWFTIPVKRCAAITVISESVRQDILQLENVDPRKVHVVPVAVPADLRPVPKTFNDSCPRVLQIGTKTNKNLPRVCEALSGIRCTLDVVGILSDVHRELLDRYGIEYRNYVGLTNSEMRERYEECDLVIFVSTFEGFGMPIIEANRVGRPVVAGNVSSMPEVAGNAAYLVNPFDVSAIRAGVMSVIGDSALREQLVRNGYENARRYDPLPIARMYEELYKMVGRRVAF